MGNKKMRINLKYVLENIQEIEKIYHIYKIYI